MSSKPSKDRRDYGQTKYNRLIKSSVDDRFAVVDVYSVIKAFDVTCPATQHAIKKLLCAGIRGKGDKERDLEEAIVAIRRAITIARDDNPDEMRRVRNPIPPKDKKSKVSRR